MGVHYVVADPITDRSSLPDEELEPGVVAQPGDVLHREGERPQYLDETPDFSHQVVALIGNSPAPQTGEALTRGARLQHGDLASPQIEVVEQCLGFKFTDVLRVDSYTRVVDDVRRRRDGVALHGREDFVAGNS